MRNLKKQISSPLFVLKRDIENERIPSQFTGSELNILEKYLKAKTTFYLSHFLVM